jgi:capsular polysaccharide biosynthesis protein
VPPLQAAKPNKPKVAMIGAIIGLLLGLAAPFVYELMINRRVRCRDDFERVFGLPVLSEFDAIEPSGSAA